MKLADHRVTDVPQSRQYRSSPPPQPAVEKSRPSPMPPFSPSFVMLDPHESAELRELADAIVADPSADPEGFCREAALQAKRLPESVWKVVWTFARAGSRKGFLVLGGMPLDDDMAATPPDNRQHLGERTITARAQAIINHVLGEMIAYEAEGRGRLFQDMVPNKKAVDTQTSQGSVELECHTEQTFSELAPDFLSLVTLRGAEDAETFVFPARDLVAGLNQHEVSVLREPLWTTGVDESVRAGGIEFVGGNLRGPFPVLAGSEHDPLIRFDYDLGWGISAEAHALHERIAELYLAHRSSYVLRPGELLLLDNARALHGRSSFKPAFDGTDRFIVRSFVVRDLTKSLHARPGDGRVVVARHS